MRRVLFVEPDDQVAEGLRRSLRPFANAWEVHFAQTAEQALAEATLTTVVVCDAAVPGLEALLLGFKTEHPRVVRTVIAGLDEKPELVARYQALSHQVLRRPLLPSLLFDLVERTVSVLEALAAPRLQTVVGQLGDLPALPATYARLAQMAQDPDVSMDMVASVVERDTAITAAVLRIINSAYFGLPRRVSSVRETVRYLGIVPLRNLVLTVELFEGLASGKRAQALQQEALLRAYAMRELLGRTALAEQAFIAGVLSDVGQLLIVSRLPVDAMAIEKAVDGGKLPWDAQEERLGCTSALVGAQLLARWNLPATLVEAVALHHVTPRGEPVANLSSALSLVAAVEWSFRAPPALRGEFRRLAEQLLPAFPSASLETIGRYFGQAEESVA